MSAVEFSSAGTTCRGVHLPGVHEASFAVGATRPCVVLGHGFSLTVDSGLERFAERFAAAGLDALAFDYRHFGVSDGEPRQLVSIPRQLEDYAAAIAYARSLPGVDPERIVVWGYSLGGGHALAAAVADARVAAVIAQMPMVDGLGALLVLYRRDGIAALAGLTLAGLRDALASLRGRAPVTIPAVGAPGAIAAMTSPDARPAVAGIAGPSWRDEVAARIALTLGGYRPGLRSERLACPLLVQIADRDQVVSIKAAQDAAFRATGRAEVRTYPIGHFDAFAGDAFERAVADQLQFLRRHLAAANRGPLAAAA
jgi:pimeloyl-ACP methyl ester carboxylesterase